VEVDAAAWGGFRDRSAVVFLLLTEKNLNIVSVWWCEWVNVSVREGHLVGFSIHRTLSHTM